VVVFVPAARAARRQGHLCADRSSLARAATWCLIRGDCRIVSADAPDRFGVMAAVPRQTAGIVSG
jgi:hypothetical protein